PRFNRINSRLAAVAGFSVAALAFLGAAFVTDYAILAALHLLAGVSAACALSFTHGTISHSANPHRLFAIVNIALGVFAIIATPNLIAAFGGRAVFATFPVSMAIAAIAAAVSFPTVTAKADKDSAVGLGHLRPAVWFGIAGVRCMALTQA